MTAPLADQVRALVEAAHEARAALHQHYVEWDGEPEDGLSLQLARSKCDVALSAIDTDQIVAALDAWRWKQAERTAKEQGYLPNTASSRYATGYEYNRLVREDVRPEVDRRGPYTGSMLSGCMDFTERPEAGIPVTDDDAVYREITKDALTPGAATCKEAVKQAILAHRAALLKALNATGNEERKS